MCSCFIPCVKPSFRILLLRRCINRWQTGVDLIPTVHVIKTLRIGRVPGNLSAYILPKGVEIAYTPTIRPTNLRENM